MSFNINAAENLVRIRSLFDINKAYCAIKTNGVTGFDNRDSAWRGSGGGISSTNSLMLLENGENEISIEMGALAWFYDKMLTIEERRHFDSQAACSLKLMRLDGKSKNEIASINVHINENGIPEAYSDTENLIVQKIDKAEQVTQGHIDDNYFFDTYFPTGMELYKFTKRISVSNVPVWEWVNATPFTGNENQLIKLRVAYEKLATIINKKNRVELKAFYKPALKAWAVATNVTEDEILLSIFTEDRIEGGKAKIMKINWGDYSVRVMNRGRMVQFYNKSETTFSPLTYEFINSRGHKALDCYAPIFSLINGKFVPVI